MDYDAVNDVKSSESASIVREGEMKKQKDSWRISDS